MDSMNTEELRKKFELGIDREVAGYLEYDNKLNKYFSTNPFVRSENKTNSQWEGYQQCAKDMQGENERLRDKLLELSKWPQLTAGGDTWQSVLGEVLYNMATEEPNNG